MIYDINGNVIATGGSGSGSGSNDDFADNMTLDYAYDSATGANYTVIRVFQTKKDGTKQYPFVRCVDPMKSTAQIAAAEGWKLIINAGVSASASQPIDGVVVQNGVVINDSPATHFVGAIPLTIDANGNLDVGAADATGTSLVSGGAVSAICGFCAIIKNYENQSFPTVSSVSHFTQNAQRQIIGQFDNGDYAIVTCAGRSFVNSDGWTLAEAQTVCQKIGLKFAYNLDGGASTSTYLRKKPILDFQPTNGRKVPTFIVFNGTTTYSVPSA